jgi:hypothetical protein
MKSAVIALITLLSANAAFATPASAPNYTCQAVDKDLNLAPIAITVTSETSVKMGPEITGEALNQDTLSQKDADGTPNNFVRFFATSGCKTAVGGFARCMAIRLETLMVNQGMFANAGTSQAILNGANYTCTLQVNN